MTAPASRVRRDLQGLRAVAVVAVVVTHLTGWPRGGFVGVDVFFVLSGFLVTGILLTDLRQSGTVRLGAFIARRVTRLLPAALVVLGAVVATAFAVFSPVRAEKTLGDALSALGLVSNWRFGIEGRDYFAATDVSPLQHFWSLSVEEQFSLLWPLVVILAVCALPAEARRGRGGRLAIGAAALAVVVASALAAVSLTPVDASLAYFSTLTRAGELGVGAVLAASAPLLARLPAFPRGLVAWTGGAVVVAAFFVVDPTQPFPAPWAAMPVVGAALVIAGGIGGDPRHRHLFVLTNPLSVALGNASYSLYLWHLPVIVFAGVLLSPGPAATAITVLTMLVLTVATYLGVEQPLHRAPWPAARSSQDATPADASTAGAPAASTPAVSAPTPPTASPAPATPRRTVAQTSRPVGWVPGQRYYPGARPPAATAASASTASSAVGLPEESAADTAIPAAPRRTAPAAPDSRPAREPSLPAAPVHVAPVPVAPVPVAPVPVAPAAAWAAWRARFAPRVAMAGATLAIGAGATVLAVFLAFGAPTLPGVAIAAPAAAQTASGDALATLQADLASAATAGAWPELHPSLDEAMRESSAANRAHDCFTPDGTPDPARCTWGSADAPHHLYLVGDSSAMAYAPAFAKLADDSGGAWRVTTVGLYGCRFTDVLVESRDPSVMATCAQRKAEVAAMIAASPADLLVVSNAFTLARTVDGRDLNAVELASAVAAEVSGWAPAGRTVYLAPPPHGVDLGRCYSPLTGPGACLAAVDDVWTQVEAATEAQAVATGDAAISALPFTCWQDVCPAFAGDTPVRYDDTHVTPAFAERLTPILRDELATRGLY